VSSVKIGKKLILSLTSGMYEDSRFIFREYIQNAADQIDIAISEGLITANEANIIIHIDKAERNIIIYDNATGIKSEEVIKQLGDVGDSDKSGDETKGFIGIGRLGGLAYCKNLIFSTSYKGERIKTIMTWNADLLHKLIHDPSIEDDASSVIQRSFSVVYEEASEDEHFFQVELNSIHDENNELLEIQKVKDYLSMVAPVPYENLFFLSAKIKDNIKENHYPKLEEYKVLINGEQIYKAYRKNIYQKQGNDRKVIDTIHDIAYEEFRKKDGELLAWMWYGISKFEKVIPNDNIQRGLRLRCKNIQIGNDKTIVEKEYFKEQRGSYYFIGEIHVVHKDIMPNARRDYFVDSKTLRYLEINLKRFCSINLGNLYHYASTIRSAFKKESQLEELVKKYEEKHEEGFASDIEKEKLNERIESTKKELEKKTKERQRIVEKAKNDIVLESSISFIEDSYSAQPQINTEKEELDKLKEDKKKYKANTLSKLNKSERKLVSRIFDIIHKALTADDAEELTNKICEELQK